MIRHHPVSALCIVAVISAAAPALAASATVPGAGLPVQTLPVDQAADAAGIPVACTGMGETRQDPKWTTYPIRVELSNGRAEYLTDAQIVLTDAKGKVLLKVSCTAPWVLLKPPAGSYAVYGQLLESSAKPRSAPFKVPSKGQIRVVLEFPDA
ncbi:MAG: hypothetical protein ACXU82_11420 [Caulobacteraceae bacterium]